MQTNKLDQLLAAKETLFAEKQRLIAHAQKPLISFSLNIPGWPKKNEIIDKFFFQLLDEIKRFCLSNRIMLDENSAQISDSAVGLSFYTVFQSDKDVQTIKTITESFEATHSCGRFIDLDIMDAEGNNISSEKEKGCFYCGKYPAIDCMRKDRHSKVTLSEYQTEKMREYLNRELRKAQADKLTELVTYALLEEASLDPKPGLVSPGSNGSHSDMDYHTFLQSIATLTPVFHSFFTESLVNNQVFSIEELRIWGLKAEQKMFAATSGINTHKGAIFLLLIASRAIINLTKNNEKRSFENIQKEIDKFTDVIRTDIITKYEDTHGNRVNEKYAEIKPGIRQQVIDGLPGVFKAGLEELVTENFSTKNDAKTQKQTLIKSLLKIITTNQDSNVLHRGNPAILKSLQNNAADSLQALEKGDMEAYYDFCQWTNQQNLSPGGSADLLAVSIFIYLCTQNKTLTTNEL